MLLQATVTKPISFLRLSGQGRCIHGRGFRVEGFVSADGRGSQIVNCMLGLSLSQLLIGNLGDHTGTTQLQGLLCQSFKLLQTIRLHLLAHSGHVPRAQPNPASGANCIQAH